LRPREAGWGLSSENTENRRHARLTLVLPKSLPPKNRYAFGVRTAYTENRLNWFAMDVLITGIGVVTPLGIGREPFLSALCEGRSGIARISSFDAGGLSVQIAAEIRNFDPKPYVANRKSLKVMCRDAQFGMVAAALACRDAGIQVGMVDPERFGVVLGADRICSELSDSEATYRACMVDQRFDFNRWATEGMARSYPLGFLRVLPNMTASHVSIAHDARGPNNTIHQNEVSGMLAIAEAADVIRRGWADVMIAGGASSQMNPFDCVHRCALGILSPRQEDPTQVMCPFDVRHDGQVWGEGAAVLILESRTHAEARKANVQGKLLGWANTYEVSGNGHPHGKGLERAIDAALRRAGLEESSLACVAAHGLSTVASDRLEAQAIHKWLPTVPVTALKSYFGNLGAASSAVEVAASMLLLQAGLVVPTLNYQQPAADCPVQVVRGTPLSSSRKTALVLSSTMIGQAVGMVVGKAD
jgi:3-oxoacyl-[acyl-carrier-protein] synthase II